VALARRLTKAEVLADEWGTRMATEVPPLPGRSSNDWEYSLDRCIIRRVSSFHRGTRNRKA
jgi:methylaspartate ammonia-lyase